MVEVSTYREDRIGGCVTLITAKSNDETHRIMIDYGSSLDGSDKADDFKELWSSTPPDAVFFTHYHGDHVGRILEIPPNIPIYMGNTARQVMINIEESLSRMSNKEEALVHKRELELLMDDSRINTFNWNGHFYDHINLPGFKVEPYSVDHSAYDSYMFLIEAEDEDNKPKVILHTGDFRGHGRRGAKLLDMIEYYIHKDGRDVDILITEGTMMSRLDEKVMSEPEMQIEAFEYFLKHKYAFLICSSTNLDSLASFYQAAQSASVPFGRYLYTYSSYFEKQLKTFSNTAGSFTDVYRFDHVHKLELNKPINHPSWSRSMTQKELMEYTGFVALIKPDTECEKIIDTFTNDYEAGIINEMPVLIYSMWDGYVDPLHKAKKEDWIDFLERMESKGVEVKHLHTSGHATAKMITEMIKAVNPKEEIIPIHTECKEAFQNLNIGEELKAKIRW